MSKSWSRFVVLGCWGLGVGIAQAAGIAGVCPDGSAFIVQKIQDVPCARAKLVPPSEMPPLRPELLPRPYNWHVDHEARNPHNPYNLIDAAQQIRAHRAQSASSGSSQRSSGPRAESLRVPEPSRGPRVALSESELRDLLRLVELRQQVAPAKLSVEDIQGREQLELKVAYSPAIEAQILAQLGDSPSARRVLVFTAQSVVGSEFHPNFFVVQDTLTFRPEPTRLEEVGFLLGEPGPLARGTPVLGYLVIPARFDPERSLDIWWNDRSFSAVLAR